jgi:Uma2 family endonuclease
MHTTMSGVKLTYDHVLRLPQDDLRHELIEGVHHVTASPNLRHQRISGRLYVALALWLREHPLGEVYYAPVDVVLSPHDVVVPDLVYVSRERAAKVLTDAAVKGTPELLVEIISPGTSRRDRTIKQALYDRWGISEYWLVDPDRDAIRVFRRSNGGLTVAADLSADDEVLSTPLLPGLEIQLATIFS